MKYLVVYFVFAEYFKCSPDYAKRFFHWKVNYIFGKITLIFSRNLSFNFTTKLCQYHCIGLEICPFKNTKTDCRRYTDFKQT